MSVYPDENTTGAAAAQYTLSFLARTNTTDQDSLGAATNITGGDEYNRVCIR